MKLENINYTNFFENIVYYNNIIHNEQSYEKLIQILNDVRQLFFVKKQITYTEYHIETINTLIDRIINKIKNCLKICK